MDSLELNKGANLNSQWSECLILEIMTSLYDTSPRLVNTSFLSIVFMSAFLFGLFDGLRKSLTINFVVVVYIIILLFLLVWPALI